MTPTSAYLEMIALHFGDECGAAAWLLAHGRSFGDWSTLPPGVKPGLPKNCYWNALQCALRGGGRYVYCEGMATCMIPTQHAWCYDRQTGLVVDPTWTKGHDYIGAPFKLAYALGAYDGNGSTPLMNQAEDFPIITGAHAAAQWREEL